MGPLLEDDDDDDDYPFADGEMDMPCTCDHCGKIFDLHNGTPSEKWHPNILICSSCGDKEEQEIALDEEAEEISEEVENSYYNVKSGLTRLKELKYFEGMPELERQRLIDNWRKTNAEIVNFWNELNEERTPTPE